MSNKRYHQNNNRAVNLETRLIAIQNRFGVSKECASYLYYRSFYSKKKDVRYLPWHIKLQNALVKADHCIGLEWEKITFGNEEEQLLEYGINVEDMPNDVFRFINESENPEESPEDKNTDDNGDTGWQVVKSSSRRKKQNKYKNTERYLITYSGLIY